MDHVPASPHLPNHSSPPLPPESLRPVLSLHPNHINNPLSIANLLDSF